MPFKVPNNPALDIDKRKYDGDASNPLRVIEKLHYHSAHNPRYIQELKTALVQTGIIPETTVQLDLFLKDDFKASRLYQKGLVFVTERKPLPSVDDDGTLGSAILGKVFKVKMPTGKMRSGLIFGDDAASDVLTSVIIDIKMNELGNSVVRAALNCFSTFTYGSLKHLYPKLKSCKEFIESSNYLANLSVKVSGNQSSLAAYSQDDKLFIAKSVLKELEPSLLNRGKSYRGTKEFKPVQFNKTFRDKIVLKVSVPAGGTQEFGVSMRTPRNPEYALDLSAVKWYAYNDNYGTSEEKALVKYIEGKMEKFEEKYDEIYLVRNEKDVKIFDFAEGRAFEPDFILFLRIKGASDKFDNLQLFIEPKGGNLLLQDKWKNDFLKQIKSMADIRWCTQTDQFFVWGLPFFNENAKKEFEDAFENEVINYTPSDPAAKVVAFAIVASSEVAEDKKYKQFLPVYSVRAACGTFEDQNTIPEEEAEGWVNIAETGVKANKNMFLVHAVGDSMKPKINEGDLCVFEMYGAESGGSRDGEIVLTQCIDKDGDYGCAYTIKKYYSEKVQNEDGTWHHTKVQFQSLNPEYNAIDVSPEDASSLLTVGILRAVL